MPPPDSSWKLMMLKRHSEQLEKTRLKSGTQKVISKAKRGEGIEIISRAAQTVSAVTKPRII